MNKNQTAYTIYDLQSDILHLKSMGAETGWIGTTYLGRRIPYVFAGSKSGPQIIVQGAIHAREHITAKLVADLAYYIFSRDIKTGGVYFVPMVNIDGVMLCTEGIQSVPYNNARRYLLDVNGGSTDFSLWKANCNAVDLNVNFDAMWGTGVQNIRYPAPENYIGTEPGSEYETQALMAFTRKVRPDMTISYHCKGRMIFWQFFQEQPERQRDRVFAERLAGMTGYSLVDGEGGSAGGYKDWCIKHFAMPAYTLEIADDAYSHPVDYRCLKDEWNQNKGVPELALSLPEK